MASGLHSFRSQSSSGRGKRAGLTVNDYNNVLGWVSAEDEHVAEVIVDLLGPRSRSGERWLCAPEMERKLTANNHTTADVLLSHALLDGNKPLVNALIQKGVVPTLDHIRVALYVRRRAVETAAVNA